MAAAETDIAPLAPGADCARLFGHQDAQTLFLDALYSGKLHHAWMLTGPKGIGKASFAWLAAKHLLSGKAEEEGLFGPPEAPADLSHDPEDPLARRIGDGGHGDVRLLTIGINEKTGKMRTEVTIDQVQKLSKLFTQTAAEGGWRVVIIDAAEDLNRSAANALLKMLEEPPARVLFFLVSHSPGRLLPTIRSRCRVLSFKPLSENEIDQVVAARLPDMAADAVGHLAGLADGAPGRALALERLDAIGLLEQLTALFSQRDGVNIPDVHAFAASLVRADQDERHQLALDFLLDSLRAIAIGTVDGAAPTAGTSSAQLPLIEALARFVSPQAAGKLWEQIGQMSEQQMRLRLDRSFFWVHVIGELAARR